MMFGWLPANFGSTYNIILSIIIDYSGIKELFSERIIKRVTSFNKSREGERWVLRCEKSQFLEELLFLNRFKYIYLFIYLSL